MSALRRPLLALAVLAVVATIAGCSHGDDGGKADQAAARSTTTVTKVAKTVTRCGGLSAADVTSLGVSGLKVVKIQDVSDVLQGPARGGQGCWFDLRRTDGKATDRASLTVLVHPKGDAYFQAATSKAAGSVAIPGLGDSAYYVAPTKDSPKATVIARRGPLVVETEIGNSKLLGQDLLIALTGLALERA